MSPCVCVSDRVRNGAGVTRRLGKIARRGGVSPITHTLSRFVRISHPPYHVYILITNKRSRVKERVDVYRSITSEVVGVSDREPWTMRVDAETKTRFKQQVDEWNGENPGHYGYHVEQALKEYMDKDRYARVEDKLDKVLAHVSDGGASHTRTTTGASDSVETARDIYRRVADNHGLVVKDDDLTRAIEDMAGADPRTVEKYKAILKRRGLIFEHPNDSPVWTTDRDKWVGWVENHVDNDPTLETTDMIEDYGMTIERFDELAEEIQ